MSSKTKKFNLILNSSNVSNISKNEYTYNFIKGNFSVPENAEIMVSSIQLPYSFYNITAKYNNQNMEIIFPTSIGWELKAIVLPEGFYTTDDINAYLQQECIKQGYYLINSSGQNVYYFNLSYNTTYYSNQVLLLKVPTSLPSGWSQPSNWKGYNSNGYTPALNFKGNMYFGITNSTLGDLLGFDYIVTYGSLPTVDTSYLSNKIPKGSNINSIIARCSLVNNYITNPSDILDSFPIGDASFGSNINFYNQLEKWVSIAPGSYSSFKITFVDQDLNQIDIRDANVLITLLLKF